MTTNEPTRLDRLEALAETILLSIQQLSQRQETTNNQISNLATETLQLFGQVLEEAERDRIIIREMQSEVRGLQTENRRILERWESHTADGHGGEA